MKEKYILETSFHCGNKGLLEEISEFTNRQYDYAENKITCYW